MKKKILALLAIGLLALSLTVFVACETTARRNPKDSTDSASISEHEHDYAFDSFVWDGFTAKVKYICANDGDHVIYFNVNVSESVTTQPTCTETGIRTYTASFSGFTDSKTEVIAALGHTYVSDKCTKCGALYNAGGKKYVRVDEGGNESATGGYILFGEYPQTVKADGVTITSTTDSRGYYLGSDGAYYAKVTANPRKSGYTFTTGATIVSGTVYYFKVEPIKWRILEDDDGTATILCEMIIDAHAYQSSYFYNSTDDKRYTSANGAPEGTYANNYEYCEIRRWLNNHFYQTAFSELERGIINTVQVDNSAKSTMPYGETWNGGANEFACEDTYDKVWLMSEEEMTKSWKYVNYASYNTSDTQRRKQTTDYAKANYAYTYTYTADYYGNSFWWLRSPSYIRSDGSRLVGSDGFASYIDYLVNFSIYGVVPALQITLESEQSGGKKYVRIDEDGNESATGGYILFGEYPQTVKADGVTITSTTDSRGYYLGSDGAYYAKVTANPRKSGYTFTTGATIVSGTVYYFKVEPIKWRILEDDDGTATILCEMIIDAHRFDDNSNNYKESEIRAWLNDNFYQTAFSELEKGIINTVQVDNSARSTMPYGVTWNGGINNYVCADTYDKVWLMSMEEITKSWKYVDYASYSTPDVQRRRHPTDYAKANYAYSYIPFDGDAWWWLRSPYYSNSLNSRDVDYGGDADHVAYVCLSDCGVVPALQITL